VYNQSNIVQSLRKIISDAPVTVTLIVVCVIAWLLQGSSQGQLTQFGVLYGPVVQAGEWWRLASSGFLHGSTIHILFNMVLLYALGHQLEQGVGSIRYGLIYAGALFAGAAAVMLFDWQQATLGASGAVMGIAAAFGVALFAQGSDPRQHPVFGLVLLNLALPLLIKGISFWGHFGGVVGGMFMAFVLLWWPMRKRDLNRHLVLVNGLLAAAALAAVAWLAARAGGY